jgi:hypothetical protein
MIPGFGKLLTGKILFADPGRDRKIEDDTVAIQRILCYRQKLNGAPAFA